MLPWQWLSAVWVYKMLLWFLVHTTIVSTHITIAQVTDNTVQCAVRVLLTKLHHKSFRYLWSSVIWPAKHKVGASTKCSCMNTTWTHPAGRESVTTTCLCTFRKSKLGRRETTDWWMYVQITLWTSSNINTFLCTYTI